MKIGFKIEVIKELETVEEYNTEANLKQISLKEKLKKVERPLGKNYFSLL